MLFNQEVEELNSSDIEIRDAKSNKRYIKSAELSEDKKAVEVELYEKLADSKYSVKVTVGEDVLEAEFEYKKTDAKVIELKEQSVVQGKEVEYKVLDENGIDITAETEVEIETDKFDFFNISKGSVKVADKATGSAFAKFVVKKDNKVIAESDKVKITAELKITAESSEAVATRVADHWTLGDAKQQLLEVKYEAEDFKVDSTVNMGGTEYLQVSVLNQFGKDFTEATVVYKSLDEDVLVADKTSGKITPLKEGKAPVKVTLLVDGKEVDSKIVELTVAAKAKLVDLKLEKEEVNLGGAVKDATVKVEGIDQFGDKISAGDYTVTSADVKVAKAVKVDTGVKVTAVTEGQTTVTVKVGEIEKTIKIVVAKAGDVAEYKVEGFREELLYKDVQSTKDVNETQMEIKVTSYDENGTPVEKLVYDTGFKTGFKIEVKDKNGKAVNVTAATLKVEDFKAEEGPFNLVVKVGTMPVFEGEFKVTDNRVAPKLSIKDNNLVFDTEGDKFIEKLTENLVFKDEKGAEVKGLQVTDVKFVSTNERVISQNADGTVNIGKDGTAGIKISEIKVKVDKDEFTIKLDNEHFNVNVKKVLTQFEKELGKLEIELSEVNKGKVNEYQKVSIKWNKLGSSLLDAPAEEVLESLVVELLDNGDNVLATSKLRLDKYSGTVRNATPASFHYLGFERTADEYPISWDRSAYKNGFAEGEDYNDTNLLKSRGFEKATKARVKIKTVTGKTIVIPPKGTK